MFVESIIVFFDGEERLAYFGAVIFGLFALSLVVGYLCKSAGVYAALACFWLGGGSVIVRLSGFSSGGAQNWFCFLLCLAGAFYLLLYALLRLRKKREEKKRAREKMLRRIEYALPDGENTFIRDRLHTALQVKGQEGEEEVFYREQIGLRLGYASEAAERVKEGALSVIERAEVDEMCKALAVYARKDGLTEGEIKALNEIFARLLKLCAKYQLPT